MSASSSNAVSGRPTVHLRVTTKRLDIEEIRGRSQYFVRYFGADCEVRVDMVDVANRTPVDMHLDMNVFSSLKDRRVEPHFGGCVYAHVVNEDNRICVTQIGTFYVRLSDVVGGAGTSNISAPVYNYSLLDTLGGDDSEISYRQGSISFSVDTVSDAGIRLHRQTNVGGRGYQFNEQIVLRYTKQFYDVCVGDTRQYTVSQSKLTAYHVPNFVTYSGVQLPASASLMWRPIVRNWRQMDEAIRSAAHVAVACYPEMFGFNRYLALLEEMTSAREPLHKLSAQHVAALRASFEILTQLSTAQPYLEDFAFGRDRSGRWRKVGDDQYCPATETDGIDCEDGAQYACQLKKLIEKRAGAIPSLSRLYSYFSHYISIMYCADENPEQSERDQGLCHVACILVPKNASVALVSDQSARSRRDFPRELASASHWTRRVGLIVPETTAITDCRVYPSGERDEQSRRETESARNVVLDFVSSDAGTYMNRDTFVSKRRGGLAKYVSGYCASGFYQWITNLWTDECASAIDLLPIYSKSGTWAVRVRDFSAQILRVQGACSEDMMQRYYGAETLSRVDSNPIRLVPRVRLSSEMRTLFSDVLTAHVPAYKLLPDQISSRKLGTVKSELIDAARAQKSLSSAMHAPITDRASYVRLDLYSTDFYSPSTSSGSRRANQLMYKIDKLIEANCGFYAVRMLVAEIYKGRDCVRITLLLFYKREKIDRAMIAHTAKRQYSKRGNFN
jgi:hypothetical protein